MRKSLLGRYLRSSSWVDTFTFHDNRDRPTLVSAETMLNVEGGKQVSTYRGAVAALFSAMRTSGSKKIEFAVCSSKGYL